MPPAPEQRDADVWFDQGGRSYTLDEIADEICRIAGRKSSVTFFSGSGEALQRLAVVVKGKPERLLIQFDPDDLPEKRDALIAALRRRRLVCDTASFKSMPDSIKAVIATYKKRRDRIAAGAELPDDLKLALMAHRQTPDDSDSPAPRPRR